MLARLRNLLRPRPDIAFDDEVREHLALLTERHIRQGMSPSDAAAAARRQFGNQTILQETRVEMQTFAPLENLARDLRYGVRLLARDRGFSIVAFLTLALGIGANTAIFGIVEALLLKPLPYPQANRIVVPATIFQRLNTETGSSAYADILDFKAERGLFDAVAAYAFADKDVTAGQEPERVRGLAVEHEYFRIMGMPILLGRAPVAEEQRVGNNRVVVLGYNFWMRRFGGDASAVGSTIDLNGRPYKVIGVLRKDSTWPVEAEIFEPFAVNLDADILRRDNHIFRAIARLQPGVTVDQAQARLTAIGTRLAQEFVSRRATNFKLHRLDHFVIGRTLRQTLLILFGASLLVLLIACVNVANLLLARSAARSREVAIRNALGAGWKRMAAQFLAESAAMAAAGGLAGLAIGYWGMRALVALAPRGVPRLDEVRIDFGVLAFTALLCLLATLIAGAGPAIQAARRSPANGFQDFSRGASAGRGAGRLRGVLVVTEMTLALVLLAGAGLLIRSFYKIQLVDPGFPTANLLTLRLALPSARYVGATSSTDGLARIETAIRRIPGVTAAGAVGSLPVGGGGFYLGRAYLREGQPEPPATSDSRGLWIPTMPGGLEAVGMRILAGRPFNEHDTKDSTRVMIVSQRLAHEMFPGQNPIGRRVRSWRDENVYREIVGVAADVRYDSLAGELGNTVYVPHAQDTWGMMVMCVRAAADPQQLLPSIRAAIWSVDKKLSISQVQTMDEIVETGMARPRFTMLLLATFGATALLLAAIGIYGVVAFNVQQRTREIGIRIALGAARSDVLRTVARNALLLALAGVVCGVAGGMALTRLMATLLYQVSPTDVRTFAAVAGLLVAVTVVAALVPARRAARVDPTVTLRYE
jgi:putative ABC transport system permease protein